MSSSVVLSVPRPFKLRAMVHSYGYYQLPPCTWDDQARTLGRAERATDGRVYFLAVREKAQESAGDVRLELTMTGRRMGRATRVELIGRVRKMLRLDEDLASFYALCRREGALRALPRLGVGRLLRGTSLFEDLVKAISWTNTTWTQAVRMIGRLGELGDPCPAMPGLRAFPSARQVLEAGGRYLRDEARLGYRAAYILELSRRVCSGELDLDALEGRARAMAAGELARELTRIRGVGKASAAYVLSMLGHYEHLILDSWTRACAARAFFDGRYPEEKEVEALFGKFGPWKALVAWFVLALSDDGYARSLSQRRSRRRPGENACG